ncbi:TIGR04372 family glycosyltransferase [Phormidium sp. CCY1219]|uniref:TIGR04372 family glycosyltransferase n=1 Tax=Phormidium sp. CCY1219 TaxID=2886104 RepID=UPI002D1E7570|nr:TIGR04372 family glycosyltransferase [Phormidium sp. CCY1219]MEB3828484.1 TIGR04372 family glycosyltransferase [Phormidium sp. CCY1219]
MKPLSKQLYEIRSGGWPVVRRKLKSLFSLLSRYSPKTLLLLILQAPWAVPGVLIIRCISPWRTIRLGTLRSERIGHFAADAGQQWAMRQQQSQQYLDLYWIQEPTCNEFWAKMVKRNFQVYAWVRPLDIWNRILPGGSLHYRPTSTTASRDIHGCLEKTQAKLPFLPEEDDQAKAWLRRQGWQDGEPFVCLLVRDSAYLDENHLHKGFDWNYHNYRDSDIATYVPAAEWLASQGVWVFRMGQIMAKPILSSHPRIIDYAFHSEKSDFLDIWLFAHCDLCISTGSGPDMVSDVYRRPLLFLNYTPLRNLFSWSNAMHLPKKLVWQASGIPLTWREHLDRSYGMTDDYAKVGIRIIDLTSEEILLAVQERWQRIQGTWVDTPTDIEQHDRFWNILQSHPDYNQYHGWIHPESRVGTTWLRAMGDSFLQ